MINCLKCDSATTCDECDSTKSIWDETTSRCVAQCPPATYENAGECAHCSDFCNECTTSYNCIKCFDGYFKFAGACRTSCPPGTYASQF